MSRFFCRMAFRAVACVPLTLGLYAVNETKSASGDASAFVLLVCAALIWTLGEMD